MSIELSDKTQMVIYCEIKRELPFGTAPHGNMMGAIDIDGESAVFNWRNRYFRDDKIFDSEDEKRWFRITAPLADLEKLKSHVIALFSKVGDNVWQLHRDGKTTEQMAHLLMVAPFAHTHLQQAGIN